MAVQDPTYDSFNYQGLLDRAVAPTDRLASGELAIAQQQGQRMFELAKAQRESDLYQSRNASELAERQRLEQLNRLQIKNENAQAVFSAVKERHPGWKPDPSKSLDDNLAAANKLTENDQFEGFKPIADAARQAQADHIALLTKAGAYQPPTWEEIKARMLNDPSLGSIFARNDIIGPGGQRLQDAIQGSTSMADISKVASNYPGAAGDRAAIIGAAQKATTDLATLKQQNAMQVAGAQGQMSANRVNTTNELLQNMISKAPASLQARMAAYVGQSPTTAAAPFPLLPPPGNPPPGNPPPAARPVDTTTPPALNSDLFGANQTLKTEAPILDNINKRLQDTEDTLTKGGRNVPYEADSDYNTGYYFQPLDDKEHAALFAQREKLLKMKGASEQRINDATATRNKIQPVSPAAPAVPNSGAPDQVAGGGLPPGAYVPVNQPAPAPGTIPGPNGSQLSPMHVQTGFNMASRLFGVDQPTLVAAHNYATSRLGMSEQQVSQLVTAAAQGDPTSTQKVKSIIAAATQSGAASGPTASLSPAASPDATSLPPMPTY